MDQIPHFIGGSKVSGSSDRFGEVFNPATGKCTGHVPFAGAEEVDFAVSAAAKAFPAWSNTSPLQRARVLFKFKELLDREDRKSVV